METEEKRKRKKFGTEMDSDQNKYFFVREACKSYPLQQLLDFNMEKISKLQQSYQWQSKCPGSLFFRCKYFDANINTPEQDTISHMYLLGLNDPLEKIALKVKEIILTRCNIDYSVTLGQEECPLTLDNFEKPYLLKYNGRTYSKEAILRVIQSTLLQDENLRLEDGTVIQPSMIGLMTLYPNLTLWKNPPSGKRAPKVISFSLEDIKIKPYDEMKAKAETIANVSAFLANMPTTGNNVWDYKAIVEWFSRYRPIEYDVSSGYLNRTVENLVIENISFPKYHPKDTIGFLTFSNVLFNRCVINLSCWCGMRVKSSKFVDCTFDVKDPAGKEVLSRSKLINCTIKITQQHFRVAPDKGEYDMRENFYSLPIIYRFVENKEGLENCKLVVE